MIVRLSGGQDPQIELHVLIFKKRDRSSTIRGIPDNLPGLAYQSGPEGWMDQPVICQCLNEPSSVKRLPNNTLFDLFFANCSGHNIDENILNAVKNLRKTVHSFSLNQIDMVQHCEFL